MDKALKSVLSLALGWLLVVLPVSGQQFIPQILAPQPVSGGVTVTVAGTLFNGAFGSPYSIALTSGIPAGDIAVNFCTSNQVNGGTAYNWVMADSKSNTWSYASTTNTTWQELSTTNGTATAFGYSKLTTALTTSDHITFTPSADGDVDCYVIDLHGASAFDQVVSAATANSTTQTSGSLTPSTTPEYGFGLFQNIQAFSAYGNVGASAATGLGNHTNTASTRVTILEWGTLNSLSAATATATIAAGDIGSSTFVLFK